MAPDKNTDRAPGLEVTLTEGEGWARTLTVTVAEDRVSRTRAAETTRLSRTMKLKGFRKGKIPTAVVEQRFGGEIDGRVQQRILDEAYREALQEKEIDPAGPGRITDIKYEPGQPFVFQAEVEVMPTITLGRTGGFQVTRTVAAVTDEEVETVLDRIRGENATWAAIDRRPVDGDRVSVRISPLEGEAEEPETVGTPYQLVLGTGKALDDVEAAIRTLTPGTVGVFSIDFPNDADQADQADPGVITRRLHIALEVCEEKQLPDLDDEFAGSVGDFDSVDALREAVRGDLGRHHEREAEDRVRGELMGALLEANPVSVPRALVDRYMQNTLQVPEDSNPDELAQMREAIGPHAERRIREQLLIEAVIEQEGFQPTPDEVETRVAELAEGAGRTAAELRRELARDGRLAELGQNLAVEKAFAYLKEQSGVS